MGCALAAAKPFASYFSQPAVGQAAVVFYQGFLLQQFVRQTSPTQPLRVYIEGDGRPWLGRGRVAADPTPTTPVALQLALADPHPNVLYLARPCQFGARPLDPHCTDNTWWTDRRYDPTLLPVFAAAIAAARQPGQPLELVGYSGGAVFAAALAADLPNVTQFATVAGNLAVAGFNQYHQVPALPHALDPITFANRLTTIPQTHWVGAADTIVPAHFAQQFVAAQGHPTTAVVKILPGVTHTTGWLDSLPQ